MVTHCFSLLLTSCKSADTLQHRPIAANRRLTRNQRDTRIVRAPRNGPPYRNRAGRPAHSDHPRSTRNPHGTCTGRVPCTHRSGNSACIWAYSSCRSRAVDSRHCIGNRAAYIHRSRKLCAIPKNEFAVRRFADKRQPRSRKRSSGSLRHSLTNRTCRQTNTSRSRRRNVARQTGALLGCRADAVAAAQRANRLATHYGMRMRFETVAAVLDATERRIGLDGDNNR